MKRRHALILLGLASSWWACQGPRDHALIVGPAPAPVAFGDGAIGPSPIGVAPPLGDGSSSATRTSGDGSSSTAPTSGDGPTPTTPVDSGSRDGGGPTTGNQTSPDAPSASTPDAAPAVCGNGVVETGEECDPPGSCPASCPNMGCTKFTLQGSAARCNSRCVEAGPEIMCKAGDGCCPASCNATNDADCSIKCDNGVKEGMETCDPLASCPAACPAMGCQLRKLVNGGTCTAACANDRQQTACVPGDGCCPAACNSTTDSDCNPKCGNNVVESGETCDPPSSCQSRQAACKDDNSTLRRPSGDPAKCTFVCTESARTCAAGSDGVCPPGCTPANDPDCKKSTGSSCSGNGECVSGFCVDGTCCGTACGAPAGGRATCGGGRCDFTCTTGMKCPNNTCAECCGDGDCTRLCTRCTGGRCGNQTASQDLKGECPDSPCHSGNCDGSGACAVDRNGAPGTKCAGPCNTCEGGGCMAHVGLQCKQQTCTNQRVADSQCNGAGACVDHFIKNCTAGQTCRGTDCVESCGREFEPCCSGVCNDTNNLFCDDRVNMCRRKLPQGSQESCDDARNQNRDDWCESNYCGRSGLCSTCGAMGENCCTSGQVACRMGVCNNGCPNNRLDPSDKDSLCEDTPIPGVMCPL
jgi:hypothetical protein